MTICPRFPLLACFLLALPAACADAGSDPGDDDSGGSDSGDTGDASNTASTTAATTAATTASTSDSATTSDPDSTGESDDAGESSTGETVDETPPEILSVTPADGDAGVRADATFVIVFSEPMDAAATEQAWESEDFPELTVTMAWNDAGDTLTVTPNGPIALGTGSDPAVVVAPQYGFAVGAAARDVAGNELVAATEVSFTAARQITTTLAPAGSLTGTIGQSGEFEFNFVAVGDTGDGQALRGFVAFEPTTLPDGILEFIEVELTLTPAAFQGTPYADLGSLVLFDAAFFDWAEAFDAGLQDLGDLCVPDMPPCSHVVTAEFAADYEADADLSQFGLRFETDSDFDGEFDSAVFYSTTEDGPRLDVQYLIE